MADDRRVIERAFELARSGRVGSVDAIRRQLKDERYDQVDAQLAGTSIARQLRGLIEAAKYRPAPPA